MPSFGKGTRAGEREQKGREKKAQVGRKRGCAGGRDARSRGGFESVKKAGSGGADPRSFDMVGLNQHMTATSLLKFSISPSFTTAQYLQVTHDLNITKQHLNHLQTRTLRT